MNALPMNLLVAAVPSSSPALSPAPAHGAAPRGPAEGGFARCLDRAVEREPAATETPPAGQTAADPQAEGPPDTPEAAPEPKPAPGTRRGLPPVGAARQRDAAVAFAATPTPAAATLTPSAADVEAASAAASVPETPAADGAADLSTLLPGWPPAALPVPAAPATPAALAAGADTRAATDTAPLSPALALASEPGHAAPSPLAPGDAAMPGAFVLPPQAGPAAGTPPAETPPTAQAHVAAPLDSPGFAPALATQVRWLVRDGLQQAQLSLNPAEMGPVTVQIVLDGREARIDFRADLAATRQAIEASLPTLAAALDDSGLRLAGGGVHDGQARQGMGPHGQPGWAGGVRSALLADDAADGAAQALAAAPRNGAARGLVDLVA